MSRLPTGTVTLLFTDIEGSTRLLGELGDRYPQVLTGHRSAMRATFVRHNGVEVDTQGDAFLVAFARASDAVAAAADAQRALSASAVRVRMGIHTGQPIRSDEGYVGIDLHRGARICAAGHGGQVLISQATRQLLDSSVELRDLGEHRLKDLHDPEWLFQLIAPDLVQQFPPLRSLNNTNLPAEASSFIGRQSELAEVRALLEREDVRIVTLTGPGGTGKTRLALRLAAQLLEDFKNGVFLVSLAALSDPEFVLATVAHTLGVKERAGETVATSLRRQLEGKSVLLVLDNFEHVLPAASPVGQMLESAPQVKVLATSRERLHLAGEHEHPVHPLSEDDAVALFDERAKATESGFRLDEHRGTVTAICRRLDFLPLAVELAAARVKLMSPEELLARLGSTPSLLVGGPRDLPQRQQTLWATIDWSYALLEAHGQRVFAQFSVFAGGCTLEAAEAICGASVDAIASLLDKSLLRRQEDRYSMLETIREFAFARLTANGEGDAASRRHAHHFLDLAERADTVLSGVDQGGPDQIAWLRRLTREHDNVRAALTWLLRRGEADSALRLSGAIWPFWETRGYFTEGRRWLERALAEPGGQMRSRSKALSAAGTLARRQGDDGAALALHEEALAAWRDLGDRRGVAWALNSLGGLKLDQGDYAAARSLCTEAMIMFRDEGGDRRGLAVSLSNLGVIARSEGGYAAARSFHEEAMVLARQLVDKRGIAASLNGLGEVARIQGEYAAARSLHEQALALARERGDKRGIALSLSNLGAVMRDQADYIAARSAHEEALALFRELGHKRSVAASLASLSTVALGQGNYGEARSLCEQALITFGELGRSAGIAGSLSTLGEVAHREGDNEQAAALQRESLTLFLDQRNRASIALGLAFLARAVAPRQPGRAARLLGAAEGVREAIGAPLPLAERAEHERSLGEVRAAVGDDAFAAAWAAGLAMTVTEAVGYALKADD